MSQTSSTPDFGALLLKLQATCDRIEKRQKALWLNQQSENREMSVEHDETLAAIQDLAAEDGTLIGTLQTSITGLDNLAKQVADLQAQIAAGGTPTPESFQDVRDTISTIKNAHVQAVTNAQADPNFAASGTAAAPGTSTGVDTPAAGASASPTTGTTGTTSGSLSGS